MAGLLGDNDYTNSLAQILLKDMGTTLKSTGRTWRPYIGYEDRTPQGRAAIDAFNKAQGPNALGYNDPSSNKNILAYYIAAIQARKAAQDQMARIYEEEQKNSLSTGQILGYDELPGQLPASSMKYKYPG